MSKINQIQNKLLELGGGEFQKLADAYLHKKGYEHINPLGSVIGSNKTRAGTPDALIPLPNGKYVFGEHTTQQEDIYKKIKGDLDKCFDEAKTGIPTETIEEVVFCHTSKFILTPSEEDSLRKECQKRGVNLSIFSIGPISYDLYQKYPGIARDFLGIKIDTGQVLSPEEFVTVYNKNRLATPLDTVFRFREKDVKTALLGLESDGLVIITGPAGVGKSRLALECCGQFVRLHPQYNVRCIYNRGADLFEDLRVHFSEPGYHLIFVDDANRINNRLEYVFQLFLEQKDDRKIKIVATVRDYALDKVRETARPYGEVILINLQSLEDKQIQELVKNEYRINNFHYLERITSIAHGNPRLAMMAAKTAAKENTLQSINNASKLYDEYYASIKKELEALDNPNLLKTAGIVAFFRTVDRSNNELMLKFEQVFNISTESFWASAKSLHNFEMLDMYEDEIVRISDQALSTYFFYLTFFKEKNLSFSTLLDNFFPRFQNRVIDAVFPVISFFSSESLLEGIRLDVDGAWKKSEKERDEQKLLQLIDTFGFLKETDTLLHVREQITKMEVEPLNLSTLRTKLDSRVESPSILSILGHFSRSSQSARKMALCLLLDYLVKRPSVFPKTLYILTENYDFKYDSYLFEFRVQRDVIETLQKKMEDGKNALVSKLFLEVSKQYLKTRFHSTFSSGPHEFSIREFQLLPTPQLLKFRQQIWHQLFRLYDVPDFKDDVVMNLREYITSSNYEPVKEIIAHDATEFLRFIDVVLNPDSYSHCTLVQDYLGFLESHNIMFDKTIRDRFKNDTYALSEILFDDWVEKRNLNLPYEEYKQIKKSRIKKYFEAYNLSEYKQFFNHCIEIKLKSANTRDEYRLRSGIEEVLEILSECKPGLYLEVVEHYLALDEPFNLNPDALVKNFIRISGSETTYESLNRYAFGTKKKWGFSFFISLPSEDVTPTHLEQLYFLYQSADPADLPYHMDFLLKFQPLDNKVVTEVTKILFGKAINDPNHIQPLSAMFYSHTEINKRLIEHFVDDIDLLKIVYFKVCESDLHKDYDGHAFALILNHDPNFALEYIDWMYAEKKLENRFIKSRFDETRDYSFLWRRDDYKELMDRIVEHIYNIERRQSPYLFSYLEVFFGRREDNAIASRQDELLSDIIGSRHSDPDFMEFIFVLIANFSPERRRTFVSLFVSFNKNFDDFKRLSLEPDGWSSNGSWVPVMQGRIDYWESIILFLNSVELLEHKQFVENEIQTLRDRMELEKKRDFMDD